MKTTKPIPDGYHTVTPYLMVDDAAGLTEFLEKAFDAKQTESIKRPDGAIMHAEVRIGDSTIMMSDACESMGPMPASIHLYLEDCDRFYKRALEAGATSVMEPADMFWGDRFGSVKDKWGNQWSIATHVEDVPPEELEQRAHAFAQQS